MSFNSISGIPYGNYNISGQGSGKIEKKGSFSEKQSLSSGKAASSTPRLDSFERSLPDLSSFDGLGIFGQLKDLSLTGSSEKYGSTVGEPELSDDAKSYYDSLKEKFGDMEFVLVGKDEMENVKANAASYGTSGKTVVLISEETVEKMASDPAYREKNEGIIQDAQEQLGKLAEALKDNPNVKSIGMMIDGEGNASYFALFDKSQKAANEQLASTREKKKAEHAADEKRAEKKEQKKRTEKKAAEKRAEKEKAEKRLEEKRNAERAEDEDRYTLYKADSIEELLAQIPAKAKAEEDADVLE